MAETLTYDPAEAQPGQLSEEEQDSLRVGEEMINQQEGRVERQYERAEEYDGPEEEEVSEDESDEIDYSFLDQLWEEAQGDFKEETLQTLSQMDPGDLAKMYLEERSQRPEVPEAVEMTEEIADELKDIVGGADEYNSMLGWAKQNLNQDEIDMYDAVMNRGDSLGAFFAVQALAGRYFDSDGQEGQLLSGRASSSSDTNTFRSQAELVAAMTDERYDNDPAYRQDVLEALDRSNLEF